jgi:hypothetical protein
MEIYQDWGLHVGAVGGLGHRSRIFESWILLVGDGFQELRHASITIYIPSLPKTLTCICGGLAM